MSEGVSGNVSSGAGYPPPAVPPRSGPPKWLLIVGGLLVVVCLIGAVIVCVLPTIFGEQIGGAFGGVAVSLVCQTENPDLSAETCDAWGADVMANNQDTFVSCQQANPQDTSALYQCLLDSGIEPPQ
jgi:hypothetical protein